MPVHQKSRRGAMSSRRVQDVPLDPADVEDMRLRIEAHQRATDAEAASAKAFRSECERAHGEFLRAIARLEEERRARHAKQLEVMEVTYARARLARPAESAELLALRRLARNITRGLAARESGRRGTPREEDGVFVRSEDGEVEDENVDASASDRFALAALERAASEAETRARASYDARVTGDTRALCAAIKKAHDRETVELARACGDAERTVLDARTEASSCRFRVDDAKKTRTKPTTAALVKDAAARAARAAAAAACAIAKRSEAAHAEALRDAARTTPGARDGVAAPRSHPRLRRSPGPPDANPRLARLAAERAKRVEHAARASFAKAAARDGIATGRAGDGRPDRLDSSDELRAGVLVFAPDDAAFADVGADGGATRTPRADDEDHPGERGGRAVASATAESEGEGASSPSEESDDSDDDDSDDDSDSDVDDSDSDDDSDDDDDDDDAVDSDSLPAFRSARFAAPGNRHRRAPRARARVGEARVVELGARGDDGKGFGALGERGVVFADAGPAGRRKRVLARDASALLGRREETFLSNARVAGRSSAPSEGAGEAEAVARLADDGDERGRPFQSKDDTSRVAERAAVDIAIEPVARADDGFGLARCRGSGLRLPPPPAALPRATEAPSLSRAIHDRRVAAARARPGAATTIREARRGLGERTWR